MEIHNRNIVTTAILEIDPANIIVNLLPVYVKFVSDGK